MVKEKQEKSNPVEFIEIGTGCASLLFSGFFNVATGDHSHGVFYGGIF